MILNSEKVIITKVVNVKTFQNTLHQDLPIVNLLLSLFSLFLYLCIYIYTHKQIHIYITYYFFHEMFVTRCCDKT